MTQTTLVRSISPVNRYDPQILRISPNSSLMPVLYRLTFHKI